MHSLGLVASRLVFDARSMCADFLGVTDARDLAFVSGCTEGMNLLLKGMLRPGDRVVVSSMEHNAVTRPLRRLQGEGVTVEVVEADNAGLVDADAVEAVVAAAPTRAVVCQHASNVSGTIQPLGDLADIAHAAGAVMLADGAQGGGHLRVDLAALGVDGYAVSGHKALLGPQGVGLVYVSPGIDPPGLIEGGTGGGSSESPEHPTQRPERYEAGTPNTPGIAGLAAAVAFLVPRADEVRAEERRLARVLHEGLLGLGFRVLGPEPDEPRVPIVSAVHPDHDPEQLAFMLDRRYGVAVRSGLHCSPAAHATLGTLETGALRFGVGWGVTEDEVGEALDALRELVA